MAPSNRNNWPSMFKSKPSFNSHHHHQWQHHCTNHSSLLSSSDCQKPICNSSAGCQEKSPEPKPRWNPKPEQIRILEAIFNSGTVNPPRDEIRKIRAHLQEYGQVGDANVFYWFQNRKSRSKHKHRHHRHSAGHFPVGPTTPSSSMGPTDMIELSASASLTAPVNQACPAPLLEPFYLQGAQPYSERYGILMGPATWTELLLGQEGNKKDSKVDKLQNPNPSVLSGLDLGPAGVAATVGVPRPISGIQDTPRLRVGGATRSMVTVFINEIAFEMISGPLNVREAFGEEAILIHSSGYPVLTDHLGCTLHPLHHGASYYLV